MDLVAKDFTPAARVILTYHDRGNETSRYANDLMNDPSRPDHLRYLRLAIQEPEAYGINRSVGVELRANGINEVRTQGVQESWVIGKAEAVKSWLLPRQKLLVSAFRWSGANVFNIFLFSAALVALPELTMWRRAAFLFVVWLLILGVTQANVRFLPNASIYLSPRQPGLLERAWPQVLSLVIATIAGILAAIAYGLLKGDIALPTFWLTP
jgi:hypothetical protein